MGKLLRKVLILLSLSGLSFPTVFAQQAESDDATEASRSTREIEEITVIAEQSFYRLRVQI